MKYSAAFIEDRIRWRAKKQGLPTNQTYFCGDAQDILTVNFTSELGKPILLSASNESNFIFLCAFGAIVKNADEEFSFLYSEMIAISDDPLVLDEEKPNLQRLLIKLNNGDEIRVFPEPYEAAFGVWNILIMLQRIC